MPTTRRYFFEHPGPWPLPEGWKTVQELLLYQCEKRSFYSDPVVEGQPFGRLAFAVTVTADHQWRCHTRAMALVNAAYRKVGLTRAHVPTPLWEPLPHHSVDRAARMAQAKRDRLREAFTHPESAPVGDLLKDLLNGPEDQTHRV